MGSRENEIVAGFVVAALVLAFGLSSLTEVSSEVFVGILIVVGVIAPMIVNAVFEKSA